MTNSPERVWGETRRKPGELVGGNSSGQKVNQGSGSSAER